MEFPRTAAMLTSDDVEVKTMLLVGTDSGVYAYTPQGDQWECTSRALEGHVVSKVVPEASATGGLLASVRERGVFRSGDGGQTWTALLEDVDPWCVASAPNGALYAGARPAAMYRSRTAGEEWEELGTVRDLSAYATWSFPSPPHVANIHSLTFSTEDHGHGLRRRRGRRRHPQPRRRRHLAGVPREPSPGRPYPGLCTGGTRHPVHRHGTRLLPQP